MQSSFHCRICILHEYRLNFATGLKGSLGLLVAVDALDQDETRVGVGVALASLVAEVLASVYCISPRSMYIVRSRAIVASSLKGVWKSFDLLDIY